MFESSVKSYNIKTEDKIGANCLPFESSVKSYNIKTCTNRNKAQTAFESSVKSYNIKTFEIALRFYPAFESSVKSYNIKKCILERSKNAVFEYLETLPEYDVSEPVNVTNTIFIIKKYAKEMVLIIRPLDYEQVILYYEAEKDILDLLRH